ncbi:hypothetical protein D3C86_1183100 [compost metagenome]
MQVKVVWHDSSTDNTNRYIKRSTIGDARNKTRDYFGEIRFGQKHLHHKAHADHGYQTNNKEFHFAHA